jgi:hypothetical protein
MKTARTAFANSAFARGHSQDLQLAMANAGRGAPKDCGENGLFLILVPLSYPVGRPIPR